MEPRNGLGEVLKLAERGEVVDSSLYIYTIVL